MRKILITTFCCMAILCVLSYRACGQKNATTDFSKLMDEPTGIGNALQPDLLSASFSAQKVSLGDTFAVTVSGAARSGRLTGASIVIAPMGNPEDIRTLELQPTDDSTIFKIQMTVQDGFKDDVYLPFTVTLSNSENKTSTFYYLPQQSANTYVVFTADQKPMTTAVQVPRLLVDLGNPMVMMTEPRASVISGNHVRLFATASDALSEIVEMELFVGGVSIAKVQNASTIQVAAFDSTMLFDGPTVIEASAMDSMGNKGYTLIEVLIDNVPETRFGIPELVKGRYYEPYTYHIAGEIQSLSIGGLNDGGNPILLTVHQDGSVQRAELNPSFFSNYGTPGIVADKPPLFRDGNVVKIPQNADNSFSPASIAEYDYNCDGRKDLISVSQHLLDIEINLMTAVVVSVSPLEIRYELPTRLVELEAKLESLLGGGPLKESCGGGIMAIVPDNYGLSAGIYCAGLGYQHRYFQLQHGVGCQVDVRLLWDVAHQGDRFRGFFNGGRQVVDQQGNLLSIPYGSETYTGSPIPILKLPKTGESLYGSFGYSIFAMAEELGHHYGLQRDRILRYDVPTKRLVINELVRNGTESWTLGNVLPQVEVVGTSSASIPFFLDERLPADGRLAKKLDCSGCSSYLFWIDQNVDTQTIEMHQNKGYFSVDESFWEPGRYYTPYTLRLMVNGEPFFKTGKTGYMLEEVVFLDSDRRADLIISDYNNPAQVRVYWFKQPELDSEPWVGQELSGLMVETRDSRMKLVDLNGDKVLDRLEANKLWINTGTNLAMQFGRPQTLPGYVSGTRLVVFDIDYDGDLDLVAGFGSYVGHDFRFSVFENTGSRNVPKYEVQPKYLQVWAGETSQDFNLADYDLPMRASSMMRSLFAIPLVSEDVRTPELYVMDDVTRVFKLRNLNKQ